MPEPIPAALELPGPGRFEVWWTPIDLDDDALARAAAALDAGSLAKADRMRRDADRRRSLLAHALLRRLLAAGTGRPPAELVLSRRCAGCGATDHGRPYLEGGPSFGISHSGDVAVVALGSPEASVAVDVEAVQPAARWEAVRKHAFGAREWAATAADPSIGRTQLWARKEALVKATGHGLAIELTRISFAPAAWAASLDHPPVADTGPANHPAPETGLGNHPAPETGLGNYPPATEAPEQPEREVPLVVDIAPGDPEAPAGPWSAADLTLAPGHCAALAWHGEPAADIRIHRAQL